MKKRLVTSALPYVNNVPHLGNLIQVLSADVFARYCRLAGYETLYVCGTDEYGTATETRALQEGKSPRELCDFYHKIHKKIYKWFGISFDHFGRTSTPQQTEIVQQMFLDLDRRGFIKEKEIEQLYCEKCGRFLADRYIKGICPSCGSENARGDQCEDCGKLLDPTELKNPQCSTCGSSPSPRKTKHLYIDLPAIQAEYEPWLNEASERGKWAKNAVQMTRSWIRDGLQMRAITRDLKWGIPVPKAGYENKVFYVWFDAPIGYISITKELSDESAGKSFEFDWKSWWLPAEAGGNADNVELFQFIGKDNIPFHTVIFPSSLIGSGRKWTMLRHMSSSEYLNYENAKFSKSKGIGVFGTDAVESGIPADVWRFYIFYSRPEKSDVQFTWKDFQEKVNAELVGNLCNLVNRTLTFVVRYFDGKIPEGGEMADLWAQVREKEAQATAFFENADEKDAFHTIFEISSIANKTFQDGEPWKAVKEDPEKAASILRNLCFVVKDLMILASPFIPQYCEKVMSFFGEKIAGGTIRGKTGGLDWSSLGKLEGVSRVKKCEIIFTPFKDEQIDEWREMYSGSQAARAKKAAAEKDAPKKEILSPEEIFAKKIVLKVAKIVSVEKNPESDKLFVEHLDDGSGQDRVIQSGLVGFLTEEELLGRRVIIADNLKPRKMRGIESRGMLLACDYNDGEKDCVDVLSCPSAAPGTVLSLEGIENAAEKPASIDADTFFSVPFSLKGGVLFCGEKKVLCEGGEIRAQNAKEGEVH